MHSPLAIAKQAITLGYGPGAASRALAEARRSLPARQATTAQTEGFDSAGFYVRRVELDLDHALDRLARINGVPALLLTPPGDSPAEWLTAVGDVLLIGSMWTHPADGDISDAIWRTWPSACSAMRSLEVTRLAGYALDMRHGKPGEHPHRRIVIEPITRRLNDAEFDLLDSMLGRVLASMQADNDAKEWWPDGRRKNQFREDGLATDVETDPDCTVAEEINRDLFEATPWTPRRTSREQREMIQNYLRIVKSKRALPYRPLVDRVDARTTKALAQLTRRPLAQSKARARQAAKALDAFIQDGRTDISAEMPDHLRARDHDEQNAVPLANKQRTFPVRPPTIRTHMRPLYIRERSGKLSVVPISELEKGYDRRTSKRWPITPEQRAAYDRKVEAWCEAQPTPQQVRHDSALFHAEWAHYDLRHPHWDTLPARPKLTKQPLVEPLAQAHEELAWAQAELDRLAADPVNPDGDSERLEWMLDTLQLWSEARQRIETLGGTIGTVVPEPQPVRVHAGTPAAPRPAVDNPYLAAERERVTHVQAKISPEILAQRARRLAALAGA